MFSRFRKATPAPATNGNKKQFNQTQLNTATANLQTALNKIANQHVLKYANAIRLNAKAQANAARATAVATQTPTPTNISTAVKANEQAGLANQSMIQAENAAEAVVTAVPTSKPVTPAVRNAETQTINATNAFMKRIDTITNANNMNNIINSNNFKGLSANNQGKVRNYSRAKFPITSAPVTGTRGTSVSLVKNSPNSQWRFRKVNANKGYVLTNSNTNSPKVYYSANLVPK